MYENYFLKKYMKNHNFFFFKQSRGEENNRRRAHTFTQLKKKKKKLGFARLLIVFMINLTNLDINYQCLSLNLTWTC